MLAVGLTAAAIALLIGAVILGIVWNRKKGRSHQVRIDDTKRPDSAGGNSRTGSV